MTLDDLIIRDMRASDVPQLHQLSVSIGWPHRASDWQLALHAGTGLVAQDEIGRLHGSVMRFGMPKAISSLGMAITAPRLQDRRVFDALIRGALDRSGGDTVFLNACKHDLDAFCANGAHWTSHVHKYEGVAVAAKGAIHRTRLAVPEDYSQIIALESEIYGADRAGVLLPLLDVSKTRVICRRGRIEGFAFARPFGRGHAIGPIVANSEHDAISLAAAFMSELEGGVVRVDTRCKAPQFVGFLKACGLTLRENVITMAIGPHASPSAERAYALSGHSHG